MRRLKSRQQPGSCRHGPGPKLEVHPVVEPRSHHGAEAIGVALDEKAVGQAAAATSGWLARGRGTGGRAASQQPRYVFAQRFGACRKGNLQGLVLVSDDPAQSLAKTSDPLDPSAAHVATPSSAKISSTRFRSSRLMTDRMLNTRLPSLMRCRAKIPGRQRSVIRCVTRASSRPARIVSAPVKGTIRPQTVATLMGSAQGSGPWPPPPSPARC